MRFEGDALILAAPEAVWAGLNDPEVLRRAIPGCQSMEQTGEREFTATVVTKVGPVSATFKGKVELADLDPPHGYTLKGRGQGGPAGFAKGEARISLEPEGASTRLRYEADADIGGKIASVGGRLIQGVAKKTAADFFAGFGRVLSGEAETKAGDTTPRAVAGATTASVPVAKRIPLIDRTAWLLVGFALGVGVALWMGGAR
ncbi:CoxG family protein [Antarcticimicrobium sediminis]|uniref:Carbon monoxide dehydrogenase n=1 Tax=Antarcticimicrobium sediminis TaxID=2546227 RepID=A0A4R5EKJ7_9RHOB|nr:carbon monoxide dehydrogenase subunit G [Antarcticimicrobium sediminis]TDE34947.1 carbon monoxide dehydrogenase [Antarcticimicrobium sediminis]